MLLIGQAKKKGCYSKMNKLEEYYDAGGKGCRNRSRLLKREFRGVSFYIPYYGQVFSSKIFMYTVIDFADAMSKVTYY